MILTILSYSNSAAVAIPGPEVVRDDQGAGFQFPTPISGTAEWSQKSILSRTIDSRDKYETGAMYSSIDRLTSILIPSYEYSIRSHRAAKSPLSLISLHVQAHDTGCDRKPKDIGVDVADLPGGSQLEPAENRREIYPWFGVGSSARAPDTARTTSMSQASLLPWRARFLHPAGEFGTLRVLVQSGYVYAIIKLSDFSNNLINSYFVVTTLFSI